MPKLMLWPGASATGKSMRSMVWLTTYGSGLPLAAFTAVSLKPPSNSRPAWRARKSSNFSASSSVPLSQAWRDGALNTRRWSASWRKPFWSSCSHRYARPSGERL